MTILHYTLGLAPERSGGLTRYSTDLIMEQLKSENARLLYPQGWKWWSNKITWKSEGVRGGIECYQLNNTFPFPIPLSYGVSSPEDLMSGRSMSQAEMESLYEQIKPDVFHIHTLMGLPKELLILFKGKGVKLIFTAHDYFGICPKVNMVNSRGEVCNSPSEQKCRECNKDSKPSLFLRLRNSKIALQLKAYVKKQL